MVLVVAGHGLLSFMDTPIGWAVRDRDRHLAVDLSVWILHAFLMPVFFVIAGFFAHLTIARAGLAGFARQRLERILVPLVVLLVPCSLAMNALWDWGKARMLGQRAPVAAQLPALRASELPVTLGHLWYLYYLLVLSALLIALVLLLRRVPARIVAMRLGALRLGVRCRRLGSSAWLPLLVAIPAAALLWCAGKLRLDTPLSFAVDPVIVAYYGLFLGWGWLWGWAWRSRGPAHADCLTAQARHVQRHWVLALACLLLLIPALTRSADPDTAARPSWAALYASAAFTCLTTAGVFALCARHVDRHVDHARPEIRLLAGASYWGYLAHLPVVVLLQITLADLAVPGPLKYLAIVACALSLCVLTYRHGIQRTFLRRVLG